MKIEQKYKIVNYDDKFNGIIVKVIKEHNSLNFYLCKIIDISLLEDSKIQEYFHNDDIYDNNWYRWIEEKYLKPLRSDKLKRLLK